MSNDPEYSPLIEKLSTLIAKVDSLVQRQDERHTENKERFTRLEQQVSGFKHESRNAIQGQNGEIWRLQRQIEDLRKSGDELRQEVETQGVTLAARLSTIEGPVKAMMALRNRIGATISLMLGIGGTVWFLVEPLYRFFSERVLVHLFPPLGGHGP